MESGLITKLAYPTFIKCSISDNLPTLPAASDSLWKCCRSSGSSCANSAMAFSHSSCAWLAISPSKRDSKNLLSSNRGGCDDNNRKQIHQVSVMMELTHCRIGRMPRKLWKENTMLFWSFYWLDFIKKMCLLPSHHSSFLDQEQWGSQEAHWTCQNHQEHLQLRKH